MFQSPVTTTWSVDANMNANVKSLHILEEEPVEAKLAVPAVSSDTELQSFPFMKLAVG